MTAAFPYVPHFCIWELTLRCNARCLHCGSAAGSARKNELSTEEALELISQLSDAGVRSITFSGGEPLLRNDWPILARAAAGRGIRIELISNGLLAAELADAIADAGFSGVTFSVDGTPDTHDRLRGKKGALAQLMKGAAALKQRGVKVGAATQINRQNERELSDIHQALREANFDGWQLQLTMPMGMAQHNADTLCLAPEALKAVETRILQIKAHSTLFIQVADNFGYMGRHEPRLRSGSPERQQFFSGCQAGLQVVGITSDGTVRGCLSQSDHFNEGNIRSESFVDIWQRRGAFAYNREFSRQQLTGDCASCPFNGICRAGCKSMARATTGTVTEIHHCLRRFEAR